MKDPGQLSNQELGKLFPVAIVDYCPGWPLSYLHEKRKIVAAFSAIPNFRIDHIGSTAIPGLAAKPTIDMLIQIGMEVKPETIKDALIPLHYHYIHKPDSPPPHMMFAKGYTMQGFNGQAFHAHVRYWGDWDELLFRNYLIMHPDTAREYEILKRKLAKQFRNDREAYTDGKTAFVACISQLARENLQ